MASNKTETKFHLQIFTPGHRMSDDQKDQTIQFLFTHLDEYGDDSADIRKAIQYSLQETSSPGGFVVTLTDTENDAVVGAVVVNETGMSGYIPENILVYIAVHADYRGHGIGKKLMHAAIGQSKGDIALHVEPDNPAKFLYEKLGFENKYLEMRLKKENLPAT